jgi:hypothetical protein
MIEEREARIEEFHARGVGMARESVTPTARPAQAQGARGQEGRMGAELWTPGPPTRTLEQPLGPRVGW